MSSDPERVYAMSEVSTSQREKASREKFVASFAGEYARAHSTPPDCMCPNNGDFCEFCLAVEDWKINDDEWRRDADPELMAVIEQQIAEGRAA